MPETRYVRIFRDGELVGQEAYEVNDEQLADEAEAAEVKTKIAAALEVDWTAAQLQTAVKLLVRRLLRKGVLP
jgi:hypothetical protein